MEDFMTQDTATPDMPELLPCPFCGEKAGYVDATNITGLHRIFHRCKVVGYLNIEGYVAASIFNNWNTRAHPPQRDTRIDVKAIVAKAMKESWDAICSDTGCHPLDIQQVKQRFLWFTAGHWASQTGQQVAHQLEVLGLLSDARKDDGNG
jgi:hypothetical protein